MRVSPANAEVFRSLWSVCVLKSQLVDLELPSNLCVTGNLLNQVADSHPQLERLALTSYPSGNVLVYLFWGFTKLQSLSLCLVKKDEDEPEKESDQVSVSVSVGMALDNLPILSLELSGEFLRRDLDDYGAFLPRPEEEIPSLTTTPQ